MRWSRHKNEGASTTPADAGWHEGAHWVAGAAAVVHAPRAGDLVETGPSTTGPARAA